MANKLARLAGIKSAPMAMPVNEEMQYRAREAMHTIHKAEEHRKDKNLMRAVKHLAKAQVKAVCK